MICRRFPGRRQPNEVDESKVEFLESLIVQHGLTGWGLFLTTDQDAKFVGQYHRRLANQFRLTTPSWSWGKGYVAEMRQSTGISSNLWLNCARIILSDHV
jgi:predicted ATP-grasp superfamily ATP-dependent carboligase